MSIHIAIPEPTSPQFVTDAAAYNLRSLPQYLHALHAAGATPIPIPLHESPQRVAKILATCHGVLLPGSPADIDPQKYGEHPIAQTAAPDPARAAVDELLLQDAFNLHKPIFGICQGHQALNTWLNGTLIQDVPSQVTATSPGSSRTSLDPWAAVEHAPERHVLEAHAVNITPGTRLASLVPRPEYQPAHQTAHHDEHAFRTSHNRPAGAELPLLEDPAHLWVNSSHHQAIRTPGDNLIVSAISPQDGVIEAVELASVAHFVLSVQWHPERTYDVSAFSRSIFQAFVQAAQVWTPRRIEESVLA